jgi:predicted metal-binding membrane protein
MSEGALERVLRRDRQVVIAAIAVIVLACWAYVLAGAGMGMPASQMSSLSMALGTAAVPAESDMGSMEGMANMMQAMAMPADWTFGYFVLMFFMWWIMMIAMMLPSAAPMILLHTAIQRKTAAGQAPWSTAAFTGGYLVAWAGFCLVAAALQWAFEATGVLSPMMLNSTSALFAAGILFFAGLYQLTPIKQACLRHCRGPIQFLTRHWRSGISGAFQMGVHHGAYCLGCCWGLMAILFFGGIMNLYWIIGLAVIVLLEKLLQIGRQLSFITGGLFLIWGAGYLYVALT